MLNDVMDIVVLLAFGEIALLLYFMKTPLCLIVNPLAEIVFIILVVRIAVSKVLTYVHMRWMIMILKINRYLDNKLVSSYSESYTFIDKLSSALLNVLKCLDLTVCDSNESFTISVFSDLFSEDPLFEFKYD